MLSCQVQAASHWWPIAQRTKSPYMGCIIRMLPGSGVASRSSGISCWDSMWQVCVISHLVSHRRTDRRLPPVFCPVGSSVTLSYLISFPCQQFFTFFPPPWPGDEEGAEKMFLWIPAASESPEVWKNLCQGNASSLLKSFCRWEKVIWHL